MLIAGGRDKGIDLEALAPVVAERAAAAVLIGESGPTLEASFRAAGLAHTERAADLETAVRRGPVERRLDFNYHPHVTIAHNLGEEQLDAAFEGLVDFRCTFEVTSFELFQQTDDGVWGPLSTFALEE